MPMDHDDDPILLPRALDPYTGGDPEAAREIYLLTLQSSRGDAAALRAALAAGDAEVAGRAAHRLKGSSTMIGAALHAHCAERIENACRGGDLAAAHAVLGEFERENGRLRARLAALVTEPPPAQATPRNARIVHHAGLATRAPLQAAHSPSPETGCAFCCEASRRSKSAAGSGFANRWPCIAVTPCPRNAARWVLVSTPSATMSSASGPGR